EVFDYLRSASARQVLTQALLATPMFETRWRWNVCRALLVERFRSGKRVPPPLVRMRAQDLLASAFPEVLACGENLPPGDLPVPLDHAIVRQTVDDCLEEPMDIARLLDVLGKLERGEIERVAVDTSEPSLLARSILSARPYAFLDDAPLEERRSQAASARRGRRQTSFDAPGELDPAIVELVRDEIWPRPESADEVHEALLWMGYVTAEEAEDWSDLIDELARAGRIVREGDRFFAKEASRDPKDILLGRLEACGPLEGDGPAFLALESAGHIFRVRIGGVVKWCERRVLARIRRLMLDSRRRAFEPVTIGVFLDFLARWQHAHPAYRLEGPAGVRSVIEQLAGFELPAAAWERHVLPLRVEGYDPAWLDQLTLTGEVAWTRLRSGKAAARSMPLALVPGDELYRWRELCSSDEAVELSAPAREVHRALSDRGALRTRDIISITGLPEADVRRGLEELIAAGLLGGDSFALLRDILVRAKASFPIDTPPPPGRWCLLGSVPCDEKPTAEDIARSLLRRWGVVFRRLLVRERQPFSWREICRELRRLELRGEVTGGRFVATVTGEQFALPHAEALLSRAAREGTEGASPFRVSAADPLNLSGVLLPGDRVPSTRRSSVVLESSNV
ncbi:MAG TPA: hypothetical protein VK116_11165, partial [Planctomycetota bacterium]|nr:hypothetical protein [Planctomycetota bacterium]